MHDSEFRTDMEPMCQPENCHRCMAVNCEEREEEFMPVEGDYIDE